MIRLETLISRDDDQIVQQPRSLSEAASEAQIYALTGVPPHAQRGMRLSQALIYARQNALHRPSRDKIRAAFLLSLRP